MNLPGQTIRKRDGGTSVPGQLATRFLFVGPSSAGTANAITSYSRSSAARTALGQGVGIEAMCWFLDQVGGESYLERLIDSCPTAAHAEYYIDLVRQKFMLRSKSTRPRFQKCSQPPRTPAWASPNCAPQSCGCAESDDRSPHGGFHARSRA